VSELLSSLGDFEPNTLIKIEGESVRALISLIGRDDLDENSLTLVDALFLTQGLPIDQTNTFIQKVLDKMAGFLGVDVVRGKDWARDPNNVNTIRTIGQKVQEFLEAIEEVRHSLLLHDRWQRHDGYDSSRHKICQRKWALDGRRRSAENRRQRPFWN